MTRSWTVLAIAVVVCGVRAAGAGEAAPPGEPIIIKASKPAGTMPAADVLAPQGQPEQAPKPKEESQPPPKAEELPPPWVAAGILPWVWALAPVALGGPGHPLRASSPPACWL